MGAVVGSMGPIPTTHERSDKLFILRWLLALLVTLIFAVLFFLLIKLPFKMVVWLFRWNRRFWGAFRE